MRYPMFLAAAAVLLPSATPGDAQAAGEPPSLQQDREEEIVVTGDRPEPEKDRKKKVCKRAVATGSIMPKITCRSVAEWDEITAKSVETLEKLRGERETRQHVQAMREAGGS